MFGRVDNLGFKTYFEFPTQADLKKFDDQQNVRVASFDIYASLNRMNIGGIQVNLTNGQASPIMGSQSDYSKHYNMELEGFEIG